MSQDIGEFVEYHIQSEPKDCDGWWRHEATETSLSLGVRKLKRYRKKHPYMRSNLFNWRLIKHTVRNEIVKV